ncbi:MAG: hypothetical protein K2K74_03965 [Lachnospiraceae bacterium]|nr:hypothetical protein [Lachnospiraceae bacterium]
MDSRIVLKQGTELGFPGMACRIDSFVGKGSNAIVYMGSYPDEQFQELRHKVLIKELFPFESRGQIYRAPAGDVCWTADAAATMALHRLSFNRGNEVHLKLLEASPEEIGANINTFSLHQTLYSVLGFSGGRSLDKELDEMREKEGSLPVHVHRMLGILDVLEVFHQSGFLHLDISPDNILLIGDGRRERVTLIDYNSVHTLCEIREGQSVYYSAKEGFTAPEIRAGKLSEIGYPADLYALTAVFYRMLSGQKLSILQTARGQVPDVADLPCLAGMPDTVSSMVRKILKRGLAVLVSKRYQTALQMRSDLEELQDRIEGKGITHPALWEKGRANISRAIRLNPALEYIRQEEKLYPILGETACGETVSLDALMQRIMSAEGSSAFLLGSGGAGKTTALMRAAYLQPAKYTGTEPAFTYLSLYGYTRGRGSYIKDLILEGLRFKPGTESIEMARHELVQLLSVPMHTKKGERPKLVILLDGLNEIPGDAGELLQEILELSRMPGVRILLAGRSDVEEIPFQRVRLRPLEQPEVARILGESGILVPEQGGIGELLRSPMMLSIYATIVLNQEKQEVISSQEQLLDKYFKAICAKAVRELPENEKERWQIEAALYYVLPELAKLMRVKNRSVSDQDMLPVLEKCYRRMRTREMARVFPGWIGHMTDIRGGTAEAEAWHGLMVHGILWRKLGMIVRDEQGRYRTSHQLIEDYLVGVQAAFDRKFAFYARIKALLAAALCALCFAGMYQWIYLPYLAPVPTEVKVPYEESVSENVLSAAFAAYISCANQYECFSELVACIQETPDNAGTYDRMVSNCRDALKTTSAVGAGQAAGYLDILYRSGEVMPWSGQPLSEEAYLSLTSLPGERARAYAEYLDVLVQAREDSSAWEFFDGEAYVEKLQAYLDADARVLGKYYNMIVAPELTAMERSTSPEEQQAYVRYMKTYALAGRQNEATKESVEDIEIYKAAQKAADMECRQSGLMTVFAGMEESE